MFNKQRALWLWLCGLYNLLGLPNVLFAQQTPSDSILQYNLLPVDIVALPHSVFSAEQSLDSNLLKQFRADNLSVFLQQHSAIYLKNYGANGLASVGLRGMAAAQTAVVWNDMPLNSGMNGLCDLNTIPLAAAQQVSLQYGTSSLANQSGGIGGAIVLNTRPMFVSQHRWTLQQQIGSFGQYNSNASMEIGSPKAHYIVQLQHQRAQNDYVYRNPYLPNFPRTRLSADSLRQYHVLGSAAWQLPHQQQLQLQAWYSHTSRQLQPPISSLNYQEQQTDVNARLLVTWQQQKSRFLWQQKIGYTKANLYYSNDTIQVESDNVYSLLFYQNKLQWQRKRWYWTQKTNYLLHHTQTNNYGGNDQSNMVQHSGLLYGQMQYQWHPRWAIQVQYRHEWHSGFAPLLLPALAVSYAPNSRCLLWGNVGMNSKIPTLNDRYWQPGGNANLRPEQAVQQEIGGSGQWQNNGRQTKLQMAVYHSYLHEQITWLPTAANPLLWSPQNLKAVEVWGGTMTANLQQEWKKYSLHLQVTYQLNSARNQIGSSPSDNSVNKQLPYTPLHQAQLNVQLRRSTYSLLMDNGYASHRYTTSDESRANALSPYLLSHLHLQKEWQWKHSTLEVRVSCYNLWNVTYYSLAARPMPLRHGRISLLYMLQT